MLKPVVDPEKSGRAVTTKLLLCAVPLPHPPASSTFVCLLTSMCPWFPHIRGFPESRDFPSQWLLGHMFSIQKQLDICVASSLWLLRGKLL